MTQFFENAFGLPGYQNIKETYEAELRWGSGLGEFLDAKIAGSTRDTGNTPQTVLRQGLPVGKKTADGKLYAWDPQAEDGRELLFGFLVVDHKVTDADGDNRDLMTTVLVAGPVRGNKLLVPGNAAAGSLTVEMKSQMKFRFILDTDITFANSFGSIVVAKSADYTVLIAENWYTFTNEDSLNQVRFTLPAVQKGLHYWFYAVENVPMSVRAASGEFITRFGDKFAKQVLYDELGEIIGNCVELISNDGGNRWLAIQSKHPGVDQPGITASTS